MTAQPAADISRPSGSYTARDITVLEGIQAIRHRPAMYIGSTSTSGLVHLLWEALDNAVDEAVAGEGTQIWVEVDQSGVVTVTDQGRGMPFDLMTYGGKKLPAATVLLTVPHSGGKFGEGAYKTAGGLHGVGATVINALSEWLELDVWRDGQHFTQRFERGKPLAHRVEPTKEKKRGTRIRWSYDRTIFEHDAYYPRETIERRMQAAAHLNRGLSLHLSMWDDEQEAVITRTFYSKEGLAEFVKQATPPGAEPLFSKPITFVQMRDEVHVEVALLPNRGYKLDLHSFANAVRTPEGGVHERGFRAALTRVANDYAARMGIIKNRDKEAFKPEVIQQGLVAAISVKLKDPQFEGQTRTSSTTHRSRASYARSSSKDSRSGSMRGRHKRGTGSRRSRTISVWRIASKPKNGWRARVSGANRPLISTRPSSRARVQTTPTGPSCSSSRARVREAMPSRGATPATRRFWPCAASPST